MGVIMKMLLIALLLLNNLYAIDITPIKTGEPAKYDGFLVSSEEMKKFRQINEEKKLLAEQNIHLKDLQVINEKRLNSYDEAYTKVSKDLRFESLKGDFKGLGGFFIGVAVTSIAAYAVTRTLK